MIFKFDRAGNMENMKMEGDIDMGRKSNKDKFQQVDVGLINQAKEEVLNTMSETAAGFESLDEIVGDEDMVQQHEMELVKEMESESDKIWDRGSRDGVVGDSVDNDESGNESNKGVMTDEELKEKMRERNMGNANMPSLSNKIKMEENKGKEWEFEFGKCYPIHRFGKIHKWQTAMNADEISNLYKSGQIYYDFEIQRGFKSNIKGEKRPLITPKHVDDILKPMQSNTIAGGALTFCYFKEYDEELEYDESNNTLVFHNKLAIVDGGHRVFSCMKMKRLNKKDSSNPDPKIFEYPVFIEYMTREQAMALFSEYAKEGKRIGKNKAEALNVFDDSYNMAKEIIETSELHNKIETVNSLPKENNIMLFSTLMNGIRIFKIQTKKDAIDVVEFLSKFWSELIYLFKDQMGNMEYKQRQEIRKQTYLLEPMFLTGLFHLSKEMMENPDNWIQKLSKLKEGNFFSRDNQLWIRNITREGGKTINTSSTQKFIIDAILNKVMK